MSLDKTLKMFNGEKWRAITPIMLTCLTVIMSVGVTLGVFILQGLRDDVRAVTQEIRNHIQDPNLHYTQKNDIDWIKQKLSQIEKIAEAGNGQGTIRK